MRAYSFILTLIASGLFLAASCAHLHESTEEELPVVEEAEVPEKPDEDVVADLPDWHQPGRSYEVTGDSLFITVAALAADSSDARAIAELGFKEAMRSGFTELIHQMLDETGLDVLSDTDASGNAEGQRQELIRLMTLDEEIIQGINPDSQSTFWHHENGQVRFYMRKGYDRAALIQAIRSM